MRDQRVGPFCKSSFVVLAVAVSMSANLAQAQMNNISIGGAGGYTKETIGNDSNSAISSKLSSRLTLFNFQSEGVYSVVGNIGVGSAHQSVSRYYLDEDKTARSALQLSGKLGAFGGYSGPASKSKDACRVVLIAGGAEIDAQYSYDGTNSGKGPGDQLGGALSVGAFGMNCKLGSETSLYVQPVYTLGLSSGANKVETAVLGGKALFVHGDRINASASAGKSLETHLLGKGEAGVDTYTTGVVAKVDAEYRITDELLLGVYANYQKAVRVYDGQNAKEITSDQQLKNEPSLAIREVGGSVRLKF